MVNCDNCVPIASEEAALSELIVNTTFIQAYFWDRRRNKRCVVDAEASGTELYFRNIA